MTTVRPVETVDAVRLADAIGHSPDRRGRPDAAESPRLVTGTTPVAAIDPVSLFAAAVEADLEVGLWIRPSERTALVGIGRAWSIETEGSDRFRAAERAFRDLASGTSGDAAAALGGDLPPVPAARRLSGPVLVGGLGFSGRRPAADDAWASFGASSMVVPAVVYRATDTGAAVTGATLEGSAASLATPAGPAPPATAGDLERLWERLLARARALEPGPGGMLARPVVAPLTVMASQPTHDAWRRIVGVCAGAVGRGRIDKVVLARRVDLRSPVELHIANALRRLAASAPESTIYAFRRDGRTFLGATPERLVRTEGRTFRTVALAGTIRRGADAAEDAALAAELLASDKDREEQRIVVAGIRDRLAPIAETLEVAPRPSVLRLRFVQHLQTEISGTLPASYGLLSVAAVLHPTPAVGGEPREPALAMIDEHEGFDRGWYAGPIGWLGADGDGELCVALRCGIVERTRATLFAGCGIVADSDPDAEWEESRIKLRAVVSALGLPGDER